MTTRSLPDIQACHTLRPELVAGARLVLADLDGCLVSEGRAFGDARAFVEACGDRLWIVSNNSTHTAPVLAALLGEEGLAVCPGQTLLAGEQTLRHLHRTDADLSVTLYASELLKREARALGLRLVDRDPDVVLLCRDLGFAIPELEKIAAQVAGGARLWVSNTDVMHPALDGRPVPETGALLAALRAILGPVTFECIGKPNVHLAQIALDHAGVAARDAVFVGDNAATDGALAHALHIPFVHLVRERAA